MRVLITGATGFVGRAVTARFLRGGWQVTALSRDAASARRVLPPEGEVLAWNPREGSPLSLTLSSTPADAVVHLAGASIAGGLWTKARKRRLWESRVDATRALVSALALSLKPPSVFVSASGMGYHGDAGDRLVSPGDPPGDGFLGRLATAWEAAAAEAEGFGARVALVRPGMILGRGGGALAPMATAFKLGAGAVLGTGRQYWPWIHLEDAAEIFFQAAQEQRENSARAAWRGPVHAVAGEPVTQREFAGELASVLRRPLWFRAPAPVLRLALGEMADLFLHGQRAREDGPARACALRYPKLADALRQALGK